MQFRRLTNGRTKASLSAYSIGKRPVVSRSLNCLEVLASSTGAPLAGGMGTFLGADVFNLYRIQQLGTPVASIGGAGVGDGVFLAGIVAVLLA